MIKMAYFLLTVSVLSRLIIQNDSNVKPKFSVAFMPNGFDPYDGQMIMMPYGGSPFSINPSEYGNSESTPPYPPNHYQKRNSVDSEVNRNRVTKKTKRRSQYETII